MVRGSILSPGAICSTIQPLGLQRELGIMRALAIFGDFVMVSFRVFALCSLALLGACGQTGPLVHPSEDSGAKGVPTNTIETPAQNPKTTTDTATPSAAE